MRPRTDLLISPKRVARTIADLAGAGRIAREHVAEALLYRGADRTRLA